MRKTAMELLVYYGWDEVLDQGHLKSIAQVMEEYSRSDNHDPYPDTEADGIVFCGKCGKMKEI